MDESTSVSSGLSPQFLLNFAFLEGVEPPCLVACDTDGDGVLGVPDAVRLLRYLFLSGPPPLNWGDRVPFCEEFGAATPGSSLGCKTPLDVCTKAGPLAVGG